MSEYKSPTHKLLNFFERSRNDWKDKAKQSKAEIRNLNCKLKYHKNKNSELKVKYNILKQQIEQLLNDQKKR